MQETAIVGFIEIYLAVPINQDDQMQIFISISMLKFSCFENN